MTVLVFELMTDDSLFYVLQSGCVSGSNILLYTKNINILKIMS